MGISVQNLVNSSTPSIKVETKFMQNYRIASPVDAGNSMFAVTNGNGDSELFTAGTNGDIWNFYPDRSSDTGYNSINTGLNGTIVSGGNDSQGRLVIFTAQGANLQYIYEVNQGATRWSSPITIEMPKSDYDNPIGGIRTKEIDGQLYVAILQTSPTGGADYAWWAWSQFNVESPTFFSAESWGHEFCRPDTAISPLNCIWTGSTAAKASVLWFDEFGQVVLTNALTGSSQFLSKDGGCCAVDADAAVDSNGKLWAFLIDINSLDLRYLENLNTPITIGKNFQSVRAVTDANGDIQVFALNNDGTLYHLNINCSKLMPICKNVTQICVAAGNSNNIDLFLMENGQDTVLHMFKEGISTNWVTERLEIQSGGEVEEYISYSTDIVLYDAAGAILANEPVCLWTPEKARLNINGATYFVDWHRKIDTTTNSAGMLSIVQETDSLAVTSFEMNVPRFMAADQSIVTEQSADVKEKLANLSGDDVMNAKDASGNFLLTGNYREQTNANSIAQACNSCMEFVGQADTSTEFAGLLLRNKKKKQGVWMRSKGSPSDLLRLRGNLPQKHWRLSFEGNRVLYQELSAEDAQKLIKGANSQYQSANGILSWLGDIGDFIIDVVEDIVEVVDYIVTTVGDAVEAAITFVLDGITYVFNACINLIEQAFDLVESIWSNVKVKFGQLFEWLGFLFSWNDILRTHRAFAYTMNQTLSFVSGATVGIQAIVDNGISSFRNQVSGIFDNAIATIGAGNISDYINSNKPCQLNLDLESQISNNIIFNNFTNNVNNSVAMNKLILAVDTGPIDRFLQVLEQFEQDPAMNSAFQEAKVYFTNLGTNPDQFLTNLLAGLLRTVEGVVQAMLIGVQAVVDTMLQIVADIIQILQTALNETWDIPFVSQFYKWLTNGAELSMLDLIALIAAIPSTVLYKLIYNKAPFADDTSVEVFTSSFTADTMLQAAGLKPCSQSMAQKLRDGGGILPKEAGTLLALGACVTTFFYGALTALCDSQVAGHVVIALPIAAFICELACQAFNFPWWLSSGGVDCNSEQGRINVLWLYNCIGISMDGVFLAISNSMPENSSDVGVVAAHLFAGIQAALSLLASVNQGALTMAGNMIYVIPGICKPLLLSGIIEATAGISIPICCGIDSLCYTSSAIISFYLVVSKTDEFMSFLQTSETLGQELCPM